MQMTKVRYSLEIGLVKSKVSHQTMVFLVEALMRASKLTRVRVAPPYAAVKVAPKGPWSKHKRKGDQRLDHYLTR